MEPTQNEIFTQCWDKLLLGSTDAHHPFYTSATATHSGSGINMRTVVLRQVVKESYQLLCYTDVRSAKISDLAVNQQLSWLFYDAGERLQVRLKGLTTISNQDDVCRQHWQNISAGGRKAYQAMPAPSSAVDTATDGLGHLQGTNDPDYGFENFAVITTQAVFLEWLWLDKDAYRRLRFKLEDGAWKAQWLIP